MKGTFQIINERLESFTGKRGKVEQHVLSLLDMDATPLLNTADYVLGEDEAKKYSGKCQGKKLELVITNAQTAFGGRLRLQGHILSVG